MKIFPVVLITIIGIIWGMSSVFMLFGIALTGAGASVSANPLFLPATLSFGLREPLSAIGLGYNSFPPLYWVILPVYFGIQILFLLKIIIQKVIIVFGFTRK